MIPLMKTPSANKITKEGISLKTILNVAADCREELRPQDIERVMELAETCGVVNEFRKWLLAAKTFTFETESEIKNWKSEVAA